MCGGFETAGERSAKRDRLHPMSMLGACPPSTPATPDTPASSAHSSGRQSHHHPLSPAPAAQGHPSGAAGARPHAAQPGGRRSTAHPDDPSSKEGAQLLMAFSKGWGPSDGKGAVTAPAAPAVPPAVPAPPASPASQSPADAADSTHATQRNQLSQIHHGPSGSTRLCVCSRHDCGSRTPRGFIRGRIIFRHRQSCGGHDCGGIGNNTTACACHIGFRLPRDDAKRREWLIILRPGISDDVMSKLDHNSYVHVNHFDSADISVGADRVKLKPSAYPRQVPASSLSKTSSEARRLESLAPPPPPPPPLTARDRKRKQRERDRARGLKRHWH